jgi:hypothetical protein
MPGTDCCSAVSSSWLGCWRRTRACLHADTTLARAGSGQMTESFRQRAKLSSLGQGVHEGSLIAQDDGGPPQRSILPGVRVGRPGEARA